MNFQKFNAKRMVTMFGAFVAVVIITYVVVTLSIDFLYEEQIRSEIIAKINESPELCEDFSSVEECIDFWNKLAFGP